MSSKKVLSFLLVLSFIPNSIFNSSKVKTTKDMYCSKIPDLIRILKLLQEGYNFHNGLNSGNVVGMYIFQKESILLQGEVSNQEDIERMNLPYDEQYSTSFSPTQIQIHSGASSIYLPMSKNEFFHILQKTICAGTIHRREFCPVVLILWPYTVSYQGHTHNRSCTSFNSRRTFLQSLFLNESKFHANNFRISHETMLAFQLQCRNESKENKDNSSVYWSVWEIYSFLEGGNNRDNLEMNEILFVNSNSESAFHKGPRNTIHTKLKRRSDFHGTLIRAVAPYFKEMKLEVDWEDDTETGEMRFTGGMAVNILKDIQIILNFSLKLIPGDFSVTSSQPNMNISNVKLVTADLLKTRQVEIMIGHTTPMPSRLKSVDMLFPSSYNRLWAYVHQPPASYARDMFSYPFQTKLWIAILITWSVLLIFTKIRIKMLSNPSDLNDEFASDAMFWSIVVAAQQGAEPPPSSLQIRALFFLIICLSRVCFNAYSAAIVSILSSEEIPIPNLQSLFRSDLPIKVTLESSNIAEIAKGLQSEGKIKDNKPFLPISDGVSKLFQSPCSFITYDHLLHVTRQAKNITEVEYCSKIRAFPLVKTRIATSMTMPKNSPLRETFNHKLLLLSERGLLSRHQQLFHRGGGVLCPKREIPYKFPLAVDDLFTALIIQLIGFILSPAILLVEHLLRKLQNNLMLNAHLHSHPPPTQLQLL